MVALPSPPHHDYQHILTHSPIQASTLDSKKRLALAIIDFLSTSLKDGTLTPEDSESIEIATSCIADTFHVDPTNKAHMTDAIGSQSLLSIYGVYEKLKGKSTASTSGASSATEGRPATPTTAKDGTASSSGPSATTPESELFKSQGNAAMARKDHKAAIDLYTRAIALSPSNPIYLSNRAAAHSATHDHASAATDAELAVAADPKYTKAWSRLGLARFVLGDAKGSMEAYGKGIEYEGNGGSEAMKKGFKTAKEKVEELEREDKAGEMAEDVDDAPGATRGGAAPGGGGGMPDLSALAGMMGGGGGGGGMPDMSAIMNNPMFASMAQNLMSNPDALQGLMQNPQLRGMAERFGMGGGGGAPGAGAGADAGAGAGRGAGGGGGGGMPDIASLLQDPSIAEM